MVPTHGADRDTAARLAVKMAEPPPAFSLSFPRSSYWSESAHTFPPAWHPQEPCDSLSTYKSVVNSL